MPSIEKQYACVEPRVARSAKERAENWAKLDRLTGKRKTEWLRFASLFESVMRRIGASPDGGWESWRIETIVGYLTLTIYPHSTVGPGWIAGRFADPAKAAARLGGVLNKHTGKWNHHYFDGWEPDTSIADFVSDLNRVLRLSKRISQAELEAICDA